MPTDFKYDVFISHSSKDKPVIRNIAERLRSDGIRVWLDEWEISPGDSIPSRIEEGLEHSRVLLLCMSADAFGSDWAGLEAGTFRFRDPLNKERRFIPLRLDESPIKGSLAQLLYIDWLPRNRENSYTKLLKACQPAARLPTFEAQDVCEQVDGQIKLLDCQGYIYAYAFSTDGKFVLTGGEDKTVRLYELSTGQCLRIFEGHTDRVWAVALSANQRVAISCSGDRALRLWDVESGQCLHLLKGHTGEVRHVEWNVDKQLALSSSDDKTLRLWNLENGQCLRVFEGHTGEIWTVALSADRRTALSGSCDRTLRLWDIETGQCLRVLEGHTEEVWAVALSANQRFAISCSGDTTLRLWDILTGQCLRVFEGHKNRVWRVVWSADESYAVSASWDGTLRQWDLETGRCLRVLTGYTGTNYRTIYGLALSTNQPIVYSGDSAGGILIGKLSNFVREMPRPEGLMPASQQLPDQIHYTNAKVLLVGDTSAGKTGLSMRLALNEWEPSDSTVGAWATQWKLPVSSDDHVEREIWLWDFGGQADQRLIHQLYMEDTALAVLVFDGQKDNLFETLDQWNRDLTRASRNSFTKLLVAGRVDAGGLRVSRSRIETFAKEHGFSCLIETSAKADIGCLELKDAILTGIPWSELPWRSSPLLFKRLKEEIIRIKDEGRVLLRINELRDALRLRLSGEDAEFKDEELKAVLGLLAGPGVIWELKFGSWVLLQPERINAYAQAVIQTLRADEQERGCILEERVLSGDLTYLSSMQRLESEEERFVLLAMHQTLVERGLCLREHTDNGPLMIFPSYYRRERPELVGHPAVLVTYRFSGFLDEIYAGLVVRLHYTGPFQQDQLWNYAADFKTMSNEKQLGVKLTRRTAGIGELEVYFDITIPIEEKIIFSRYIHDYLLQKAKDVVRLRHYVCQYCGTPVGNREVAMERLEEWLEMSAPKNAARPIKVRPTKGRIPTIICSRCEKRVPLWDDLEQCFASPEMQMRVQNLQKQREIRLDNESKERALVGDVISTVALAGQISREFNVSDYGIDMEIEFKNDAGEPTGQKVYLQLKSGDSYLRERQRDGREVFTIRNQRHVHYWMAQAFPVVLVIRTSDGEIRWMEVRDTLKREKLKREMDKLEGPVNTIIFHGQRFDVMAVRSWRDDSFSRSFQVIP